MLARLAAVSLFLVALAACQSGENSIELQAAWAPEAPSVAQNGIFYVTIVNNSEADDRLLGAASDACATAELHETYENENGLMGMRYLPDGLVIPAGETVLFEVGGLHIMCLDKTADFNAGSHFPLTLTFANVGVLTVEAEVR